MIILSSNANIEYMEYAEENAKIEKIIKNARKKSGMTQAELAKKLGVSPVTISRWEHGRQTPRREELNILLTLSGEEQQSQRKSAPPKSDQPSNVRIDGNFIEIPVLSIETAASCGAGNGLYGVEPSTADTVIIESGQFHRIDDRRRPFGIRTEGDSMEGAGITEGAIAVINPAEDTISGDAVLISWNDNWFIKWILYNPDGSVELRSANPVYGPIKIEKEYAEDPSWFRVIGKVTSIIRREKPKRAF